MLEVSVLAKSYAGYSVLSTVDFRVRENQLCLLTGAKNSGKSVLLKLISGQEKCSAGAILIDKKPADSEKVALIFANHSLHPQSTIYDNLAYRLYLKGIDRKAIRQRITRVSKLLNLTALLNLYPEDLTIYSYIRAVFARACVQQADYYLLDDSWQGFSFAVKKRLARLLSHLQQSEQFSVIYANSSEESADDEMRKIFMQIDQHLELKYGKIIKVKNKSCNG